MTKKDSKSIIDLDGIEIYILLKFAEEKFKKFLLNTIKGKKAIRHIHLLRLSEILDKCFEEIDNLKKKLEIPDNQEFSESVSLIFELMVLPFLQEHLYCLINTHIDRIRENHKLNRIVINKMMSEIELEIKNTLDMFKFQMDLSDMKWTKGSNLTPAQMDEMKMKSGLADKFLGKKRRKYEIEAFNEIEKIYVKSIEDGKKISYKSLAIFIARTKLGLIHKKEQENFYKRFSDYKKSKK
jgi:hypothetical protein